MKMPWLLAGFLSSLALADLPHATATVSSAVTYYQQVAPLVNQQCQTCHQPGAIASFLPLTNYAQVKALAKQIGKVTAARSMPPFNPDNSGACASYQNARVLTEQDIATFAAWVEQGTPEGDPVQLPPPISSNQLPGQTHQTGMTEAYTPDAAEHDDYRCFVMGPGFSGSQPKYLTDYLVVPGNDKLVHHVVVYQATSAQAGDAAVKNDAAEAGPGYSCFGGAGVSGIRMLMNWSPGTGVVRFPEKTGIRMDPDLPLIVQFHYHIVGTPGPDQSQIKMKLVDKVPLEMTPTFLSPAKPLSIPPQQASYVHAGTSSLSNSLGKSKALRVMGIRSHMHKLGSQMRVTVGSAGNERCLIDVPHYDYQWQTSYFLNQPVDITSQEAINIRCVYDSTGRDTTTTWGEGTDDEMCLTTLYTVPR